MANKVINNVKLNVSFTKANVHTSNIVSNDNISTSFGKIAKWYDDFNPVIWTGDADTINGKTVDVDVPADAKFTDTTYETMIGATESAQGTSGLVPTPDIGEQNMFLRGDGTWNEPTYITYDIATSDTPGLVKSSNQINVDESGSMIIVDNSHNHTVENISGLQTSLANKIDKSLKGVANGIAELDDIGKIPSSQLPSYVDDVIEGYLNDGKFYEESEHTTEVTSESGKIYIDLTTNKSYRWSGSVYTEISASITIGETSTTAYRGDRGKAAYDHSQMTFGNPHNVTKTDIGLDNVENKSSSDIRGEITKTNVTDALGYTPPEQDTVYNNATTSTDGLMTSSDKSKLDGIEDNANNYVHPMTSGNKHIPTGGSSGQILRWGSDGTAIWGDDNNTDTKVTQSVTNAKEFRTILMGTNSNAVASGLEPTTTGQVYHSSKLYAQPSTGTIYAGHLTLAEAGYVNLAYNGRIWQTQKDATSSSYSTAIGWVTGTKPESGYVANIGRHNTGGGSDTDSKGAITILPYDTTVEPWSGKVGLYIKKNYVSIDNDQLVTKSMANSSYAPITKCLYSGTGSSSVTLTDSQSNYNLLIINTSVGTFSHMVGKTTVTHTFCSYPTSGSTGTVDLCNICTDISVDKKVSVSVSSVAVTGDGTSATSSTVSHTVNITSVHALKLS